MFTLVTLVAALIPHFSTSPSRFIGVFGGVPNGLTIGVGRRRMLLAEYVWTAEQLRALTALSAAVELSASQWKRQRTSTLGVSTGQEEDGLLKLLARTRAYL